jgi:hypothetical protein
VVVLGCSDIGEGLIAMELRIGASTSTGEPLSGGTVWLEDREMPVDDRNREHRVCETDKNGRCSGQVKYRYAVQRPLGYPGKTRRKQPERFQIRVVSTGAEGSITLPPLTSEQLHGLEPVQLDVIVSAVPPQGDPRDDVPQQAHRLRE